MGDHTKIEWVVALAKKRGAIPATWNPIDGCSRASAGCRNCWAAELVHNRLSRSPATAARYAGLTDIAPDGAARFTGAVRLAERALDQPLKAKRPRVYFVGDMADLFHPALADADAALTWIFDIMQRCPQHLFLLLTKRPDRMREFIERDAVRRGGPLANVWAGATVEDQGRADVRVPDLLATLAAVRFLSCEPLLGPVDISEYLWPVCGWWRGFQYKSYAEAKAAGAECGLKRQALVSAASRFVDWAIIGGESGPGARPMHPEWARGLRDQCATAGVPFFFKQWGDWAPHPYATRSSGIATDRNAVWLDHYGHEALMERVGKKAAGRLLDGVVHDAVPEVA